MVGAARKTRTLCLTLFMATRLIGFCARFCELHLRTENCRILFRHVIKYKLSSWKTIYSSSDSLNIVSNIGILITVRYLLYIAHTKFVTQKLQILESVLDKTLS